MAKDVDAVNQQVAPIQGSHERRSIARAPMFRHDKHEPARRHGFG